MHTSPRSAGASKEYCVTYVNNPDIINGTGFIRSMEQVLVDLMTDEEAGLRYIERRNAILLEIAARTLEAAKGGIDLLWLGEDLGTQHSPLDQPGTFPQTHPAAPPALC